MVPAGDLDQILAQGARPDGTAEPLTSREGNHSALLQSSRMAPLRGSPSETTPHWLQLGSEAIRHERSQLLGGGPEAGFRSGCRPVSIPPPFNAVGAGGLRPGREHCAPRARCARACVTVLPNVHGVHDTLAPVFDQEAASCRVRPGLIFSVVARRGREFLYTRAARGSLYPTLLRFTRAVVAMRAPLQLDNVLAGARVGLRFYPRQIGTR